MTDRDNLSRTVRDPIARNGEGAYWDFKCRHHAEKGDLVHDILCLANAEHRGPRFLVFGVDDADFSLHDIKAATGLGPRPTLPACSEVMRRSSSSRGSRRSICPRL